MNVIKPLFLVCVLLSTQCCGQTSFDEHVTGLYKGTVPLITSEELTEGNTSDDFVFLDTRSKEEFDISHLKKAQLIDYESFQKKDVKHIPKDAKIVVYCSVGYRSERIGERLINMGYKNVQNLYGGIFDWKNKDFEIVNKIELPTDSVHTYNLLWSKWLYKGTKIY